MKRLTAVFIIAVMLAVLCAVPASAADPEFDISDGVLLKYNGSSSEVSVPAGVYSVGASAFENNKTIEKVTLPATVHSVGDRAFYNCSSLTDVTADGLSTAGVLAFNGTPFFDSSTDEFFTLGSCLLWYNGTSKRVDLPSGIVGIAPYAFLRCDSVTAFKARTGLVSVGEGAFYECSALSEVTLPSTVSYIGAAAFDGTAYLSGVSGFAVLGDGVLVKYTGSAAEPKIPDSVRRIGPEAFKENTYLKKMTVPAAVYSIDSSAFQGCTALGRLSLTAGLVYIGDSAFEGCVSLKTVETPLTLSYIGDSAFSDCTALDHAGIGGKNLRIASDAFFGCKAMRYALLSSGVSEISDYAFSSCSALLGISVAPETKTVGSQALFNCRKATVYCDKNSPAAAALASYKTDNSRGDPDGSGKMTVLDVAKIQRYLVDLETLDVRGICVSDADFDGRVSVLDATRIQRTLAGLD